MESKRSADKHNSTHDLGYGFNIIHSGRRDESPLLRMEDVGIMPNTAVAAAWREAGKEWKAASPTL